MRRKDKEIQDTDEILEIIRKAPVCRLGLCRDNVPYVVPLSFGYREGCLYFHCAEQGKKMEMIRASPRVCFEIDIEVEVIASGRPCDWGMRYASVIGLGKASVLEDPEEKKKGLDVIMEHYSPGPPQPYSQSVLKRTAVVRVQVEEMTGKRSGP